MDEIYKLDYDRCLIDELKLYILCDYSVYDLIHTYMQIFKTLTYPILCDCVVSPSAMMIVHCIIHGCR